MLARTLRGVGQTLITLGLVVLLFCVYELYFTGFETARDQQALRSEVGRLWDRGGGSYVGRVTPVPLGSGMAVIRIPRLGRDYAKVVVEGISVADLRKGPGHYPQSQLPGQLGNFVVSGHRTTYGAPFNRLDELRKDDAIVIETRDNWYVYRMAAQQVVSPRAVEVTFPVPGQPQARPTKELITLTTCHPKFSASKRLIVTGELELVRSKAEGPPTALAGGLSVYAWIWRHLPGRLLGKLVGSLLLVAAAVALLFVFVFPYAERNLPFNEVTVTPTEQADPPPER